MTAQPSFDVAGAIRAMWSQQEYYACMYPELHMRVWATPEGMRVVAALWLPGPKYGRRVQVLQEATWAPAEVTERTVVDWGRRALAEWLGREAEEALQEAGD